MLRTRSLLAVLGAGAAAMALAAGCGSSGSGSQQGKNTVSVLYAGSLVHLMETSIGPGFSHATGYGYEGFGAGSTEIANQINDGVRQGDVFISASPKADAALSGAKNGNRVSWYARFAEAPLVLGYQANGKFAGDLKSRPWYRIVTDPSIKVGRTDPKLDPKGVLTVAAVTEAAAKLHDPALLKALPSFEVFPEETLVSRLESGQLDAGFFYSNEAAAQGFPTTPLSPASARATFTVTVVHKAPDSTGAIAFVGYLLGPQGTAKLKAGGLTVIPPLTAGNAGAVPQQLKQVVGAR